MANCKVKERVNDDRSFNLPLSDFRWWGEQKIKTSIILSSAIHFFRKFVRNLLFFRFKLHTLQVVTNIFIHSSVVEKENIRDFSTFEQIIKINSDKNKDGTK